MHKTCFSPFSSCSLRPIGPMGLAALAGALLSAGSAVAQDAAIAPLSGVPIGGQSWYLSGDGSAHAGFLNNQDGYVATPAAGTVFIGAPAGHSTAVPRALDRDGTTVVGSSYPTPSTNAAFRWTATRGFDVITAPAGLPATNASAQACSADGSVVVGSSGSGVANDEAALGDLPSGPVWAFARGINGDGSVIIGDGAVGGGNSRPFLWTAGTGIVALADYAAGLGAANLQDWELLTVNGISDDGDIVIGTGRRLGTLTSYRLDLRDPVVGVTQCTPAAVNSTGAAGKLTALGAAGASAADLTLFVSSLPAAAQCMLLVAPALGSPIQPVNSQGFLCLNGPIGRFAGQTFVTSTFGAGALRVDLSALPSPTGAVAALPGQTWSFQAWHRDAQPGPTSNFTPAVSLLVQ